MKHPKKCDGCKAFWQSQMSYHCELGYEIATRKVGKFSDKYGSADIVCVFPKGGCCPKPRTIGELLKAKNAREVTK